MVKRSCRSPGCPAIVPAGAYKGRCATCNQQADKQRGTTAERGYSGDHQRLRAAFQDAIDAGRPVTCWRCHTILVGTAWHLDHTYDRQGYRGPACIPCNLELAGRAAHGQVAMGDGAR